MLEEVLSLQENLWGTDAKQNLDYFRWKYLENPYGSEPLIYVALHRNKVVGMRGFWPIGCRANLTGERITMICAGDTVFAPGHRGRGLFRKIGNRALSDFSRQGFEFVLNFSNSIHTRLLSLRQGWRRVAPFTDLRYGFTDPPPQQLPCLQPLKRRINSLLGGKIQRRMRLARKAARPLSPRMRARPPHGESVLGEPRSGPQKETTPKPGSIFWGPDLFPDAAASLASTNQPRDRIVLDANSSHFSWLFGDPRLNYRFLYAWGAAELEGYLAIATDLTTESTVERLVDWQFRTNGVANALIEAATTVVGGQELHSWGLSMDLELELTFARFGFRPQQRLDRRRRPAPGPLIVNTAQNSSGSRWTVGGLDALDGRTWDFRPIWGD